MIDAMRQLALDWLSWELGDDHADPEEWYRQIQLSDPGRLFSFLIDPGEKIELYYTLRPDPDDEELAVLEVHDFRERDHLRLPFNQPSGSQSAQLGPVLKRTAGGKGRKEEPGPSLKIQETTLKQFEKISKQARPWSPYFSRAASCFRRKKLRDLTKGETKTSDETALSLAIQQIAGKKTVYLCYQEPNGSLPGEVREYVGYLLDILKNTKYATESIGAEPKRFCSLCGRGPTTVFPNAMRGSGLDLNNMDRAGAFPGVDDALAWRRFAACGCCADLLYVYKSCVSGKFLAPVAGEKALIIPSTQADRSKRRKFIEKVKRFVEGASKGEVTAREDALLRLLAEDSAVTELMFLWANFGNRIEDVRGMVSDVLPSRLREIESIHRELRSAKSPIFPEHELDDFQYDLSLSILGSLLHRPGDKKVKSLNESKRLFDLRRDLAAAIYHAHGRLPRRFWDEVLVTARCHLDQAQVQNDAWRLLYEGFSEKTNTAYLTAAGWVLQLGRFLHYLRLMGLLPMPDASYHPRSDALKPYFVQESAIDTRQKAFAFILGALFGKMMQVQAARGVNVGSNALTWLKRLTLTGRDLPNLYTQVREKLLHYETEGNETVREIVTELGELGSVTKWDVDLDQVQTCYFFLLGQSLATRIMPSKDKQKGEE